MCCRSVVKSYFVRIIAAVSVFFVGLVVCNPNCLAQTQSCHTSLQSLGIYLCTSHDDFQAIVQLADADFQVRQAAKERLKHRGVEAWDLLAAANRSRNHEIAASSKRLAQQVDFQSELRHSSNALAGYRKMNFADRARAIIFLGRKFEVEDQKMLAQLVRFESDEFLSRCAAIEIITGGKHDRQTCFKMVRNSHRVAAQWLRTDAEAAEKGMKVWRPVIDAILQSSTGHRLRLDGRRLAQWYAEQCLRDGDSEEATRVATEIAVVLPVDQAKYVELMDWCLANQLYSVAQSVIDHARSLEQDDENLKWREAELAMQTGNPNHAESCIQEALALYEEAPSHLLQQAMIMKSVDLTHMAERALQHLIEHDECNAISKVHASRVLAELVVESQGSMPAAIVLKHCLDTHLSNGPTNALPQTVHDAVKVRWHYFSYLAIRTDSPADAKKHLMDAMKIAPNQTDVLIAMVGHLGEGDEEWNAQVRENLQEALDARVFNIEKLRNQFNPDPKKDRILQVELANELNSFAWLASQTSVRLGEAEDAAREANALHPGSGKMLDTLAACLNRQGKWAEAIAVQQRALVRSPHSVAMRRKLQAYQRAWATAELPSQLPSFMR